MEPKSKRIKLTLENTKEDEDVPFNFNNLPDDVLRIVFNYLSISERIIFAGVCKKWQEFLKDPVPIFWKKVVVLFQSDRTHLSSHGRTYKLLRMLSKNVTCLKLYYEYGYYHSVIFSPISLHLLEKCPNLEELVIVNAALDTEKKYAIDLSEAFSKKMRILKLHDVDASEVNDEIELTFEKTFVSEIEVLDISHGDIYIAPVFLLQMPCLTKLYLAGKSLEKKYFDSISNVISKLKILDFKHLDVTTDKLRHFLQIVRENCGNLIELYICFNKLKDEDVGLLKDISVLPQLKVICFRGCGVSYKMIDSLIDSKPCLEIVYVGTKDKPEYNKSKYNYSKCRSPAKVIRRLKVKDEDDCEHDEVCPLFRNEL